MSLIRYEPWSLVRRARSDLDRMLEAGDGNGAAVTRWYPAVDIREEAERFVLRADLPGVSPQQIEVTAQDGILELKGEREQREAGDGYRRVERVSGRFLRRFTLPEGVEAEGIEATSNNGVLEVSIPKPARAERRKVTVQAA